MRTRPEKEYAHLILRLLLEDTLPLNALLCADWDTMLSIAQRNGVLIRLAEQLDRRGIVMPGAFTEAVASERRRIQQAMQLVRQIEGLCAEHGIACLFAKAFQHYPDMGQDLDLFVLSVTRDVDAPILQEWPSSKRKAGLCHRIAGTTTYEIEGFPVALDVHHGRMGRLGEERSYLWVLAKNSVPVSIEGGHFCAPRPEDLLILQGMQRGYGCGYLRLADIVAAILWLQKDGLDWEYILQTSQKLGILAGLCCYLSCVDQIYVDLFHSRLLYASVAERLSLPEGGRPDFRDGHYRFPTFRVAGRLYRKKLQALVAARNWEGAGRLCLLPVVAMAAAGARLKRRCLPPHKRSAFLR